MHAVAATVSTGYSMSRNAVSTGYAVSRNAVSTGDSMSGSAVSANAAVVKSMRCMPGVPAGVGAARRYRCKQEESEAEDRRHLIHLPEPIR